MKTQYLILFLIVLSFFSCRKDDSVNLEYTQHQFDFSSEWTYRFYGEYTGSVAYTALDTTHYWFEGDTIMERYTRSEFDEVSTTADNYVYHILKFNKHFYFNPQNGTPVTETEGVKAYIREGIPNETYYITYVDTSVGVGWEYLAGNEEALLWDFSLEANDSLNWCRWYVVQEGSNWLMGDKETIYAQNHQFEQLNLYNSSNTSYLNTSMLVGIGSINGIDVLSKNNSLIHYHCDYFDYFP